MCVCLTRCRAKKKNLYCACHTSCTYAKEDYDMQDKKTWGYFKGISNMFLFSKNTFFKILIIFLNFASKTQHFFCSLTANTPLPMFCWGVFISHKHTNFSKGLQEFSFFCPFFFYLVFHNCKKCNKFYFLYPIRWKFAMPFSTKFTYFPFSQRKIWFYRIFFLNSFFASAATFAVPFDTIWCSQMKNFQHLFEKIVSLFANVYFFPSERKERKRDRESRREHMLPQNVDACVCRLSAWLAGGDKCFCFVASESKWHCAPQNHAPNFCRFVTQMAKKEWKNQKNQLRSCCIYFFFLISYLKDWWRGV